VLNVDQGAPRPRIFRCSIGSVRLQFPVVVHRTRQGISYKLQLFGEFVYNN